MTDLKERRYILQQKLDQLTDDIKSIENDELLINAELKSIRQNQNEENDNPHLYLLDIEDYRALFEELQTKLRIYRTKRKELKLVQKEIKYIDSLQSDGCMSLIILLFVVFSLI